MNTSKAVKNKVIMIDRLWIRSKQYLRDDI